MRQRCSVSIVLLIGAMLLLGACAGQQVTLDGTPVTEPTIQRAAQAVKAADVTHASIVHFLTAGHASGAIPLTVLPAYLADVAPAMQAALFTARGLLVTMAKTPGVTTEARVQQALAELTKMLQQAMVFAQQHGWLQ